MKRTKHSWAIIILIASINNVFAQQNTPWQQYKDVNQAGFSEKVLDSIQQEFAKMNSSSFMVVHKGNVVLSLGDPTRRFMCHSIRKSFMSSMYGMYLEQGKLNLESTLRDLGIQDKESLSGIELNATIKNLLSARSGIYHPAAYEPRSMTANRPERGSSKPNESFFYNNWDFNTLVSIFNQETNQDFFKAFMKDIANPIGMEDLRFEDMNYRNEPDKSVHPAYLFKMSTRDLARFGQLYLNKGIWNEERIVPEKWIEESTKIHSVPLGFDGRDGYGYLWWIDNHSFGETAYYASGLGGHLMYVFPTSEMVIVHRVNSYLMMGEGVDKINNLINMVLKAKTTEETKQPKLVALTVPEKSKELITVPREILTQYVGAYDHPFFKEMNVLLEKDQLKVTGEILGNFRLIPKSNNTFEVEDIPELPLEMKAASAENPRGKATTLVNEKRIPTKIVIYY